MTTPISILRDNFTDNTGGGVWGASFVAGSATLAETSGQARMTLPSSTAGTHQAYYWTNTTYDLTADSFYINIETMVSTSVAAAAIFDLYHSSGNALRWVQQSGTLKAQTIVGGAATDRYSVAWNASTYKYLRIRESGGNVLFDSSSNGTSWTNRASVAAPFAVTALRVRFGAECGNVASPGSFRLDDVNLILPALSTTWRWTQVEWPLLYRFKAITIAATSGQGYIATSNDGTTWAYYSGPIGSSSGGYQALTLASTQAAAEAMAVNLPADGRWDLPSIVECRFIRLYHRSITGSAYTLREYYPRRLVQSDDIEAESIRAINIAAHQITADHIATINLDATARITAGGGMVTLDDAGMSLTANLTGTVTTPESITWYDATGANVENYIWSYDQAGTWSLDIVSLRNPGATKYGSVTIRGEGSSADGEIQIKGSNSGGASVQINCATTQWGGLNAGVGATGAADGEIRTTGNVAFGTNTSSTIRLLLKGASTTSSDYGIVCQNSTPGNTMYVRNDSVGYLNNTAWTYASDATKKRNIRAIGRDIMHLMQLKPVRFDYIDGPADRVGFIAQDVQAVFPELIEVQPDGTLGMRTDELMPIMLHALKRLIRLLINKGVITAQDVAGIEPEP